MSELYYQKVVSSSSEGKLEVYDQEVLEEYLCGLFKRGKSLEKMTELIEFGQRCINAGEDGIALRVFENGYHSISTLPCDNKGKLEFAKLVKESFGHLYNSSNEAVWEGTGELLTACEELIGKLGEGLEK